MPDLYGITEEAKENIRILAKALEMPMIQTVDVVVKGTLADLYESEDDALSNLTVQEVEHVRRIHAELEAGEKID